MRFLVRTIVAVIRTKIHRYHWERLCPTTPAKERKLMKAGKAHVYCRTPFTIQLDYKTGGSATPQKVGTDTGDQHIGFAVRDGERILYKSEV